MFYELLKPASHAYFSLWQLNLNLMNSQGHFSCFYGVWWSQWWFRWICLSFNVEVHIRTALRLHYSQLFIMAIRMHFQLTGGCLVHLQTKWAANLHYSISIYPGILFTYTGYDKTSFVTVMRLNSHTYIQLWDLKAHTKQPRCSVVLSPCVQHHTRHD